MFGGNLAGPRVSMYVRTYVTLDRHLPITFLRGVNFKEEERVNKGSLRKKISLLEEKKEILSEKRRRRKC